LDVIASASEAIQNLSASSFRGASKTSEPGISRFRVWSFGPSRNDQKAGLLRRLRPLAQTLCVVAGNDGFAAVGSERMTAAVCRSAVGRAGPAATLTRPKIAVASIRRDLRALTKGITDETEEDHKTDRRKNPIGHDLVLRSLAGLAQPYVSRTLHFRSVEAAIRVRFNRSFAAATGCDRAANGSSPASVSGRHTGCDR
jgi:hypothetical protein